MGRRNWKPTEEQRAQVRALAHHLVPQADIAAFLDVDLKTLKKHCSEEIKAKARGLVALKQRAYLRAQEDDDVLMFYLRTQCGWSGTRADAEAADRRRFAHEKEMAKLNAELRNNEGQEEDYPLLPAIFEESPEVKH